MKISGVNGSSSFVENTGGRGVVKDNYNKCTLSLIFLHKANVAGLDLLKANGLLTLQGKLHSARRKCSPEFSKCGEIPLNHLSHILNDNYAVLQHFTHKKFLSYFSHK